MNSPNPLYRPPRHGAAAAEFRMLSLKGRIGRLRMIAYPMILAFLMIPLFIPVAMFADTESVLLVVWMTFVGLLYIGLTVVWTLRRVRDFNGPWWLALGFVLTLVFFPIVNLVLWFIPGSKEENRHGPVPPPNGIGVYLCALLMPAVAILGILAAIAIPAYHDYTVRAMIQEGTNLADPARTALQNACAEGTLGEASGNTKLELPPAASYGDNSAVVQSIEAGAYDDDTALVVITFKAFGNEVVQAGDQVFFTGDCGSGGMTWTVSAADEFPAKYLPRL